MSSSLSSSVVEHIEHVQPHEESMRYVKLARRGKHAHVKLARRSINVAAAR